MRSSSDMIDIQIEDSLARETLMNIDSTKIGSGFINIFCLIILLLGYFLFCVFYGDAIKHNKYEKEIKQTDFIEVFPFNPPINCYNCFLGISISFIYQHQNNNFDQNNNNLISLSTKTEISNIVQTNITSQNYFIESSKLNKNNFLYIVNQKIFNDNITKISIEFKLPQAVKLSHYILKVEFDDICFTLIFNVAKFVLFLVQTIIGSLLIFNLSKIPHRMWHLEQKLTLPLCILIFFYDFPYSYLFKFINAKAIVIMEAFLNCLFTSYLHFFIISLFDSLSFKNRKINHYFFGIKIIFFLIHFIFSFYTKIQNDPLLFEQNDQIFLDPLKGISSMPIIIIEFLYITWVVYYTINSYFKVDITERYKYNIYVIISWLSFIPVLIINIGSSFFTLDFFRYSPIKYFSFLIENFYVANIALFHWPYEFLHDKQFDADDIDHKLVYSLNDLTMRSDSGEILF